MTLLLRLAAPAAACPDVDAALDDAYAALATADLPRVEARLAEVREGWGCGPVAPPAQLARARLAAGVLATWNGLPDDAAPAFAAARRADRTLAADAFGDAARAAFTAAGDPAGAATLALLAPLERGEALWLDGAPAAAPVATTPGLHLAQVTRFGVALWSADVFLAPDAAVTVEVVRPPAGERPRRWHGAPRVAVGLDAAGGPELAADLEGETLRQAGPRLGVPIELGYTLASAGFAVRPELVAAPLLTAPYLFAGEEEPARSPLALGAGVAAAVPAGAGAVGANVCVLFPGQLRARLTGAVPIAPHLDLEGRAGVVVGTDGAPWPTAAVSLAWLGARAGGAR